MSSIYPKTDRYSYTHNTRTYTNMQNPQQPPAAAPVSGYLTGKRLPEEKIPRSDAKRRYDAMAQARRYADPEKREMILEAKRQKTKDARLARELLRKCEEEKAARAEENAVLQRVNAQLSEKEKGEMRVRGSLAGQSVYEMNADLVPRELRVSYVNSQPTLFLADIEKKLPLIFGLPNINKESGTVKNNLNNIRSLFRALPGGDLADLYPILATGDPKLDRFESYVRSMKSLKRPYGILNAGSRADAAACISQCLILMHVPLNDRETRLKSIDRIFDTLTVQYALYRHQRTIASRKVPSMSALLRAATQLEQSLGESSTQASHRYIPRFIVLAYGSIIMRAELNRVVLVRSRAGLVSDSQNYIVASSAQGSQALVVLRKFKTSGHYPEKEARLTPEASDVLRMHIKAANILPNGTTPIFNESALNTAVNKLKTAVRIDDEPGTAGKGKGKKTKKDAGKTDWDGLFSFLRRSAESTLAAPVLASIRATKEPDLGQLNALCDAIASAGHSVTTSVTTYICDLQDEPAL